MSKIINVNQAADILKLDSGTVRRRIKSNENDAIRQTYENLKYFNFYENVNDIPGSPSSIQIQNKIDNAPLNIITSPDNVPLNINSNLDNTSLNIKTSVDNASLNINTSVEITKIGKNISSAISGLT